MLLQLLQEIHYRAQVCIVPHTNASHSELNCPDQILALHSTILLKARADSYNEIISVFDKDEDYASISGGNASRTHGEFNLLAEIAATFVRTMFNEFAIDPHTLPSFVE